MQKGRVRVQLKEENKPVKPEIPNRKPTCSSSNYTAPQCTREREETVSDTVSIAVFFFLSIFRTCAHVEAWRVDSQIADEAKGRHCECRPCCRRKEPQTEERQMKGALSLCQLQRGTFPSSCFFFLENNDDFFLSFFYLYLYIYLRCSLLCC